MPPVRAPRDTGLLALTLLTPAAGAAPQPALGRHLDAVVAAGTPGALVLVDDGSTRRAAARGLAVLEGRVPLRAGDRFRAGSITKTFVAVVALQLVAEKRLRLEDTVERWLPGSRSRRRADHRAGAARAHSGLPDYTTSAFLARTAREPARAWAPREVVRLALAEGRTQRGRFSYASTNYVVLGLIVERASGSTIERELRRRLIAPLGLRDTSFAAGTAIPGRHVHGYSPSQHDGLVGSLATARDRDGVSASWAWAAGALVSSAPDISRVLRRPPPGPPAAGAPARRHAAAPGARYGLGLAAFRTRCGTAIGHTGNLLGTVSAAWNSADGRRRVVAMSNSYPLSPAADTALRSLLEHAFCDG